MTTIENDYLKVIIKEQGAELTSIYNKKDHTEHLWNANPEVWPWHSPNLFPVVGECLDKTILVDGKTYHPMGRHGFTRTSRFVTIEAHPVSVEYSLAYNEETLAVYPFKFDFRVLYELIDNQLKVTYKVINKDDKAIYFSVGAHPAFNVPFYPGEKYEDYFLEFDQQESFNKFRLTPEGYLLEETEPVEHEGNTIRLTKELFKEDAMVFKNVASRKVTIRSKNHDQFLEVSFPQFRHLGIWAKYGADFVCIEPWLGYADTAGKRTEFKDKEAILKLETGSTFETDMMIGF